MSLTAQKVVMGAKKHPVLVLCIIVSLLLLAVIYFRAGLITEQQAKLDELTKQGARYRTNISNAAQLQEQLNFMIKANEAVKARALPVDALAVNLQYFYRLEAEVGVKYLDLRPGSRTETTPAKAEKRSYVPINYILAVQGTFAQIITFLKNLEQGAYFCRITNASASNSDDIVTINLSLDLLGVP